MDRFDAGRLLVDEVDEPPEQAGVGRGQDAVAEVEDVTGTAGGLGEHPPGAGLGRVPAGQQPRASRLPWTPRS